MAAGSVAGHGSRRALRCAPHHEAGVLAQTRVELVERRRARAQLLLAERVERRVDGREVCVQIVRIAVHIEQPGDDLALGRVIEQEAHRGELVVDVVFGVELAQRDLRAVVLLDDLDRARLVVDLDRLAAGDEVEPVHRLVVHAHVVEALGRAEVVVERDAGREHVDEGRALVLDRRLDDRHELRLVAGERARHEGRAELHRHRDQVDRGVVVDRAALRLRAAVGGGGELAFGQAVHAVVLDDVDHVDAAADRVRELPEPDRGAVAVARDAEIDQVAVGEVGAGEHRGHAPVHRIEAVRLAEEIGRRLRRAADARQLGDAVRLDRELEAGLDDRGRDRVVAAAGAQRRDRALVVAVGVAERILRQRGVVEFRLDDVGHDITLRSGVTFNASR